MGSQRRCSLINVLNMSDLLAQKLSVELLKAVRQSLDVRLELQCLFVRHTHEDKSDTECLVYCVVTFTVVTTYSH